MKKVGGIFRLSEHNTTIKQEVMAGAIGYFTIVYIIAVNAMILSEAGIPFEGAVMATILATFVGSLLMAFWANAPILLVPGMGINAMFTYTIVQSMGFTWPEALAVVFISGILFMVIAFTKLSKILSESIPKTLKEAITVGLGMFLLLIGLEKGGLVERGSNAIIALGDISDIKVIATIITFLITIFLFMRNVKGQFLWSIIFGTLLGLLLGIDPKDTGTSFNLSDYAAVFAGVSFDKLLYLPFWIAAFSVTMVLVFENIGLIHGHLDMVGQPQKYSKSFQANAVSATVSGIFGTSPTVSTVESAACMTAGGRTGLTSLTTGILFLASIWFIPYLKWIPDHAIAPILMIIGGLMIQNVKNMDLRDLSEAFPAIFIIAMIPFTYSIADGIAIGFILYPILKIASGKAKDVTTPLYIIAFLFLINFVVHSIH
ncbi:AGZA family xanthine/uracil permease-like MFS transporter [Bacillus pakistanensis]|uniref:AGZA family xanthine/uracil permease-like MFS transporter n=1 Tax=Rossellomorea pakistanensis TaxID=992288 RepID=A0ABS2N8N3_9BACI|nr:NCS2 family permease [Bacillus pakistanensis]MBM7584188.1 AGZA family xanthine/uracil permease-like MFS transporter [Bacillus pakistanensis]